MIRIASLNDLPEIVVMDNEAVEQRFATADPRPATVDQRINWFRDHDPLIHPIYVFDTDRSVRGWCWQSSYRDGREALLETAEISYYVRDDSRRQGLGSALVQHAVREAPHLGKRILFGILLERNEGSIRLMRKCGFELWGRLPPMSLPSTENSSVTSITDEGCKTWRSNTRSKPRSVWSSSSMCSIDPPLVNDDRSAIERAWKEWSRMPASSSPRGMGSNWSASPD